MELQDAFVRINFGKKNPCNVKDRSCVWLGHIALHAMELQRCLCPNKFWKKNPCNVKDRSCVWHGHIALHAMEFQDGSIVLRNHHVGNCKKKDNA